MSTPNLPATIFKDKKITVSADGSIMFYSLEYQEAYRAKSIGAFTESLYKFILSSNVLRKISKQDVRILDLCFGLGYNCAITFDLAQKSGHQNRVHIVSIEKDVHLLHLIRDYLPIWPIDGYNIIRECLGYRQKGGNHKHFSMEMHNYDALDVLYNLTGKFDIIYFDPFSISKNPEMWSVAVFERMRELLTNDGVLVTYACGKQARANMSAAGLCIEETAAVVGAFHPGTRATRIKA